MLTLVYYFWCSCVYFAYEIFIFVFFFLFVLCEKLTCFRVKPNPLNTMSRVDWISLIYHLYALVKQPLQSFLTWRPSDPWNMYPSHREYNLGNVTMRRKLVTYIVSWEGRRWQERSYRGMGECAWERKREQAREAIILAYHYKSHLQVL